MYSIKSYNPPKPFWAMSIPELVLYNKNANTLTNTFSLKRKKQKKIEELEIEKIEKRKNEEKTRRILSKSLNLKLKI